MVAYLQEMYVCVLGGLSVGNVKGNAGCSRTHTHTCTQHVYCGLGSVLTARDQVTQCSEVLRQKKASETTHRNARDSIV